jgi:hypothetical protein
MIEYLGFVDEIGRTTDGKYVYRFDFTVDKDTIWGEYFNITPSAIIPDLQADINSLTKQAKVIFPREMVIAKKNFCFSMQDCIDGIIPLIFCEIDEETIIIDEKPFFIRFGETYENVEKILEKAGLSFFDVEIVEKGDDSMIDELINSLEDDDEDNFDDENF